MFSSRRLTYIFLFILFYSPSLFSKGTDSIVQYWTHFEVNGVFESNPDFLYQFQSKLVFSEDTPTINERELRGGVGYQLKPNLTLWGGYVWKAEQNQLSPQSLDISNALWEQLSWTIWNRQDIVLKSRLRLAQGVIHGGSSVALRIREKVSMEFPHKLFGRYAPYASEELFLNLNNPNWLSKTWVDQNRVFVGVKIPLQHNLIFKVGYLNVFKFRDPRNLLIHAPQLTLEANLDD